MSTTPTGPEHEGEDRAADPGQPGGGDGRDDPQAPFIPDETQDEEVVTARRAPQYPRFIVLGAIVFGAVAGILTLSVPAQKEVSRTEVLGYMVLVGIAVGAAVGALVAIIADYVGRRRGRTVQATRYRSLPEDPIALEAHRLDRPADGAAPDEPGDPESRPGDGSGRREP